MFEREDDPGVIGRAELASVMQLVEPKKREDVGIRSIGWLLGMLLARYPALG